MDLSPIKKIDLVLKAFHENGKNGLNEHQAKDIAGILDDEEFRRIYMRLKQDKYIISDGVRYIITYDGVIFHLMNGYMGKYDEQVAISRMNQRMEKNAQDLVDWTENLATRTRELRNWTRAVAIGAIGLVIWEIAAFIWEHFLKAHCC